MEWVSFIIGVAVGFVLLLILIAINAYFFTRKNKMDLGDMVKSEVMKGDQK